MPFFYDLATGKYFDADTGDEITREEQEQKSTESIQDSQSTTDIMIELLENGDIDVDELDGAAWEAIKDEYIRQYLLAKGGRDNMTQADWGRIGGMLSEQRKRYNEMIRLLRNGDISPAEARRRLRMYINSGVESYYRAFGLEALRAGFDEVAWFLGITENHCATCPAWASDGWQTACDNGGFPAAGGCQFPGNGATECLTNCTCRLEYRKSTNTSLFF